MSTKKISLPKFVRAREILTKGKKQVVCSSILMGVGQLMYKQWTKGIIYLVVNLLAIAYFVLFGGRAIVGFFTLGRVTANPWMGVEGDNSAIMLITGLLNIILLALYLAVYFGNISDVYTTQCRVEAGKAPRTFKQEAKDLVGQKFYKTALALPIVGVATFSILPIVFMILVAFTNYGGNIVPPKLFDWVGFDNFVKIVSLSQYAPTFGKILGWNFLWAISTTFINYMAGLGLALLLNKKCIRGRTFWRAFPILAYAVPGFITLLAFKYMFSIDGPINQMIKAGGGSVINFLGIDAKWVVRSIGIGVNAWMCIPSIMLLATGVLSNADKGLYEAAYIDGASKWKQFTKITLPFVVFSTTPVLISQFIANFNNFGIFHFLRERFYMEDMGYFLASDTDLLINWLYNMSVDKNYYSIGAAISIIIFIITSIIALVVYIKSPAYRQEDTFR